MAVLLRRAALLTDSSERVLEQRGWHGYAERILAHLQLLSHRAAVHSAGRDAAHALGALDAVHVDALAAARLVERHFLNGNNLLDLRAALVDRLAQDVALDRSERVVVADVYASVLLSAAGFDYLRPVRVDWRTSVRR